MAKYNIEMINHDMKKYVNPCVFSLILMDIVGLGDDDYIIDKYRDIDNNNEFMVKLFISQEMKIIQSLSAKGVDLVRFSFPYYIKCKKSELDFESIYYSCMPPVSAPDNVIDFFIWYYQVYFGNIENIINFNDEIIESFDKDIFNKKSEYWK